MGTMSFGYYFDQGVKVGYDISVKNINPFGGLRLSNVSRKDKERIIKEIMANTGRSREEITVERVENKW